jgi:D-aminopeptidase
MTMFNPGTEPGDDSMSKPAELLGPHIVDAQIRQAISLCWMMLPEKKRNVSSLVAEIRRIVDRALKNVQEDAQSFEMTGD